MALTDERCAGRVNAARLRKLGRLRRHAHRPQGQGKGDGEGKRRSRQLAVGGVRVEGPDDQLGSRLVAKPAKLPQVVIGQPPAAVPGLRILHIL